MKSQLFFVINLCYNYDLYHLQNWDTNHEKKSQNWDKKFDL